MDSLKYNDSLGEPSKHLVFKIIVIGATAVGKSCLLLQLTERCFPDNHEITIGVEFGTFLTHMDDQPIKLQIWDTAGQESYRSILKTYYRNAHAALVVYDITRRTTFDYLNGWIEEAKRNAGPDIVCTIVGNKCDCFNNRQVTEEEGKKFASDHNVDFFETSAKDATRVEEAFVKTCEKIFSKWKRGEIKDIVMPTDALIPGRPLTPNETQTKKNCC
eukprot:TRINITY_DN2814_c0_g1_i1.p1 TRINITY_DN2814_c0_g1~~TRINITY_DN2814_c0_g1_i1.p1  ORF type:complete len:217 (+),score=36.09 TRINITY_DN2814_c0_g1_i1:97-747(+)